tara:strand:- start:659 stop:949 length:291 start_codon:yes stop_codon:yes gene_type:complete
MHFTTNQTNIDHWKEYMTTKNHADLYKQLSDDLRDEPVLMTAKRVEKLLDISSTTRWRLQDKKLLEVVKHGNEQQSRIRITKHSVIKYILEAALGE